MGGNDECAAVVERNPPVSWIARKFQVTRFIHKISQAIVRDVASPAVLLSNNRDGLANGLYEVC